MMKRILMLFIVVVLGFSCHNGDEDKNLVVQTYDSSPTEIDLLNKINHFRDSIGVGEVQLVQHVSYKCYEHNQYMIQTNTINHDYFQDRVNNIQQVCGAVKVSEILAFNYQTNNNVMHAWINSPCHDTIIESEFSRIGISVTVNPTNNKKYYTVIFLD